MLQRLHQIGTKCLPQQRRHGALRLQITGENRLARRIIANENATQPLPQIVEITGKAQNGHDFAGDADLEAVEAGRAVCFTAQSDFNPPQSTVVHIHTAAEYHPFGVNIKHIPLMNMIVNQGGKQVVGSGNGMNIAGKVQVDLLHRQHL